MSIASPKPGVSTTVSLSFTPRSSISTVDASNLTVCLVFAVTGVHDYLNVQLVHCNEKIRLVYKIKSTNSIRNGAFGIQVRQKQTVDECRLSQTRLANHHERELKTFFDGLTMHLVRQIGKTDKTRRLSIVELLEQNNKTRKITRNYGQIKRGTGKILSVL